MENRERTAQKGAQTLPLADDDLLHASGGAGYSSIQCKRCGKTFADLDQYKRHIEEGCSPKAQPRNRRR